MVVVVQTKTVRVQVAVETEAEAFEQARAVAQLKEPGFSARDVRLEFVGESTLEVGTRVVHTIFGGGEIEALTPVGGDNAFRVTVRFDTGDTKTIHGPKHFLRPEDLT